MASNPVTLLVDGDIIAYRASAACDGRCYVIKWINTEGGMETLEEKYKKDADKMVKSLETQGLKPSIMLTHHPEPIANAYNLVDIMMESMQVNMAPDIGGIKEVRVFLSIGGSFREKEYPAYKANRAELRRPKHLNACKDFLKKKYGAVSFDGEYEADDAMAFNQKSDGSTVICSIDKDLLQVPGQHYNFVKKQWTFVDEEQGWRNLYTQLLTGDATDGIPGIKGVGPKTAEKLLQDAHSPFTMYCICLKTYLQKMKKEEMESTEDFQERIVAMVRQNARLLYLLRTPSDEWEAPSA